MENTLLLESNISSICKRLAMKRIISKRKNKKKSLTHFELCTRQSCPAYTPLLHGLTPFILTVVFLQYFPGYFLLVFLKGYHTFLFSEITFLYLNSMAGELSALPKRAVSSTNTLLLKVPHLFSFFFLFYKSLFFSLLPYFLSYILNMTDFCYLFQVSQELLFLFMSSLHLLSLLFKHLSIILGNVRRDRGKHSNIEKRQKNFLFYLCIIDLGTIMVFFR